MTRKSKGSRKYVPRDEFRMNDSPSVKGHPHYVFGETKNNYKSFGLTHKPSNRYRSYEMERNPEPNPKDSRPSYMQLKVVTTKKKYLSELLSGWGLSKNDRAVVRHETKRYKKSTNKHKPGYYNAKRKK